MPARNAAKASAARTMARLSSATGLSLTAVFRPPALSPLCLPARGFCANSPPSQAHCRRRWFQVTSCQLAPAATLASQAQNQDSGRWERGWFGRQSLLIICTFKSGYPAHKCSKMVKTVKRRQKPRPPRIPWYLRLASHLTLCRAPSLPFGTMHVLMHACKHSHIRTAAPPRIIPIPAL